MSTPTYTQHVSSMRMSLNTVKRLHSTLILSMYIGTSLVTDAQSTSINLDPTHSTMFVQKLFVPELFAQMNLVFHHTHPWKPIVSPQ